MRKKIVRINAWFSFVFFALMSVVTILILFTEEFNIFQIVTLLLFLVMSVTGFYARKIGLKDFIKYKYSIVFAIISLCGAVFFVVAVPFFLIYLFGFPNSVTAIITSMIIFLPIFIASTSILLLKLNTRVKNPESGIFKKTADNSRFKKLGLRC